MTCSRPRDLEVVDCLRYRRATVDDIMRFARICRVGNIMRPYVEAMVLH